MDQAYISGEVMVERMKDDIKSVWDAIGGRIIKVAKKFRVAYCSNCFLAELGGTPLPP